MPRDNPFEPMIKNIGNYVSGTLYAQGVIPPIGITNYDGTALASPADTHLLAAKDPVIDEIAVGMTGNLIGENTVTGAPPLQLPNSAGYPLQWLNIALSPYQEGTGDPSPDNVRPIHGTDKLNLFVEESYDPAATPKAVIILNNTLYGGTYDAVTGVGTIDKAIVDLGTLDWDFVSIAAWNCWTSSSIASLKAKGVSNIICSNYAVGVVYGTADNNIISGNANNGNIYIRDTSYSDATSFKAAMSGVQLVYELATPIPFTTDGHAITTPKGNVYTWATAEDGSVDSMGASYIQNE